MEQCKYVFRFGMNKGAQCSKQVERDGYCKSCWGKIPVQAQLKTDRGKKHMSGESDLDVEIKDKNNLTQAKLQLQ